MASPNVTYEEASPARPDAIVRASRREGRARLNLA
jgi:hypothetical protein